MIRIVITAAAYCALSGETIPPREALAPQGGGYSLWVTPHHLARLKALRGPSESYSDVILRLAAEEVVQ